MAELNGRKSQKGSRCRRWRAWRVRRVGAADVCLRASPQSDAHCAAIGQLAQLDQHGARFMSMQGFHPAQHLDTQASWLLFWAKVVLDRR